MPARKTDEYGLEDNFNRYQTPQCLASHLPNGRLDSVNAMSFSLPFAPPN